MSMPVGLSLCMHVCIVRACMCMYVCVCVCVRVCVDVCMLVGCAGCRAAPEASCGADATPGRRAPPIVAMWWWWR